MTIERWAVELSVRFAPGAQATIPLEAESGIPPGLPPKLRKKRPNSEGRLLFLNESRKKWRTKRPSYPVLAAAIKAWPRLRALASDSEFDATPGQPTTCAAAQLIADLIDSGGRRLRVCRLR